jgi:hypothetical protein
MFQSYLKEFETQTPHSKTPKISSSPLKPKESGK